MTALPDLYKLYKLSDKAHIYKSFSHPTWSQPLRRWISTHPKVIKDILNSSSFGVVNHEIKKIENKFDINLDHLSRLVEFLPVTKDSVEHKVLRKEFAITIQKNFEKSLAFFESEFYHLTHHLFKSKNEIDLCKDLLLPTILKTNQIISEIENINSDELVSLSTIFDETLNIEARIKLNLSLEKIINLLKIDYDLNACYFRMALFALGNDSALSTISESLICMFLKHPNQTLSSMKWPSEIPATGVPVIERVCLSDIVIAGVNIKKGQRARLYLDAAGYEGETCPHYASLYFGSGAHLCLGMPLASKMWEIVIQTLSKISKKVKMLEVKPRKNDNVFNVYEAIRIKIDD